MIETCVQQNCAAIASGVGHGLSGQPRAECVGTDDEFDSEALLAREPSHPGCIPLTTRVQRPLVIVEGRIIPTRFGVSQNQERFHSAIDAQRPSRIATNPPTRTWSSHPTRASTPTLTRLPTRERTPPPAVKAPSVDVKLPEENVSRV